MSQLDRITKESLAAREIIATAIGEWYGGSPKRLQARAEAIIARLSNHKPPILLEIEDEKGDWKCEKCGGQMEMFTADLDRCRDCGYQRDGR
jgi:Zn finger protein HypA/HybF involved in hydrogenase expression